MKCPQCSVLARLKKKVELGQGAVYRIYRCEQPACGYRFTSIEQEAGPTARGGFRGSKLTTEDVAEIRALLQIGSLTYPQLAKAYGVSQPTIAQIAAGNRWRNIPAMPLSDLSPQQAALLAEPRSTVARDRLLQRALPARSLLKELVERGYGIKRMRKALTDAGFVSRTGKSLSQETIENWLKVLGLERRTKKTTIHGLDSGPFPCQTKEVNRQCLQSMNALQHWIANRTIDLPAYEPQMSAESAAAAFMQAHESVSHLEGNVPAVALQVLTGIDDSTFCGIAAAVAKYASSITQVDEFERIGKMLDACNAMACVFGGMGAN